MKVNTNIPIFIVLTLFVASNAFLYTYLNNDYFIDKKPTIQEKEIENIIFKLIADHEQILIERNKQILLEAERLRNMRSTTTDSAELKAIEDKLRALEEESKAVQDRVKNSENERRVAQKKSQNDQLQLSELMESNSRMGVELDQVNEEFTNYVSTLQDTLTSNSFSEKDINEINIAFRNRRGLLYLDDLVENIQTNRTSLSKNFTQQLLDRSNEYHEGLKNIATLVNENKFLGNIDDKDLLITNSSVEKLKTTINKYLTLVDKNNTTDLNSQLTNQKDLMLKDLEEQLAALRESESLKLQEALDELNLTNEEMTLAEREQAELDAAAELEQAELDAAAEKSLSLEELEKKLREELTKQEKTVFRSTLTPDTPIDTSWVHIPALWTSEGKQLAFNGMKVNSIAWSRNSIGNNNTILFNADFKNNGECLIILYGNGRFKSWSDGVIISLTKTGLSNVLVNITQNGLDENSEVLYTNTLSTENGINGDYYLQISDGKLTMKIDDTQILDSFNIPVELNGRLGFGNRETSGNAFNISNINLFQIK
ncbi:MAG: hypothetical protein OCD02_23685 [Spirochaetaceae bacterium]